MLAQTERPRLARPQPGVNRAGRHPGPQLVAESDVEVIADAEFRATGREPWLTLDPGTAVAGRWITIRYRAGFLQDPIRPLLRIERRSGATDYVALPGPVLGAGWWTGKIPPDATRLSVNPVLGEGLFAFSVDAIRRVSRLRLLAGAVLRDPKLTAGAVLLRLRGRNMRARHFMTVMHGSTPLERYAGWRRGRAAPPRLASPDPAGRARIGVVVDIADAGAEALGRTLRALGVQSVPSAGTWLAGGSLGPDLRAAAAGAGGPAPEHLADEVAAGRVAAACDWLVLLRAGDVPDPDALASLGAAVARDPELTLLYADEDHLGDDGAFVTPLLKPDWSPRLQQATPYLGRLLTVPAGALLGVPLEGGSLADRVLSRRVAEPGLRVGHVRRVLLHRAGPVAADAPPARARVKIVRDASPLVSAVIPNRDSLDLLRTCIDGLRTRTAYPRLEIVVVDNGSFQEATHAFYRELAAVEPRFKLLKRPGPFNFSRLTNQGVRASAGDIVLMLNNDIEMIRPDWLDIMVDEASAPDVGAVGAKLLYPDGRVQHSGVVTGLGGHAGHVQRGRPDRAGWMHALSASHEVSAVTGACLAVSRAKYDAVGGLDEKLFPIAFNDIDLCLKLRHEGWRNILAPGAVLFHHESASRGRDIGPKQARADQEGRHFARRWLPVMRDDPFFHPALSLLRFDVSLG